MENLPEEIIYNIAGFLEHRHNRNKDSKDLISLHFVNKNLFNMYKYNIRSILKLLGAKYENTSIIHNYDGKGNSSSIRNYCEETYYYGKELHEILEKLNIKVPEIKEDYLKLNMVNNDEIYHPYYKILFDIGYNFLISDYFEDENKDIEHYPSGGYMRHYFYHIISINDKKYVISMNTLCPESPYRCVIKNNGIIPKKSINT